MWVLEPKPLPVLVLDQSLQVVFRDSWISRVQQRPVLKVLFPKRFSTESILTRSRLVERNEDALEFHACASLSRRARSSGEVKVFLASLSASSGVMGLFSMSQEL